MEDDRDKWEELHSCVQCYFPVTFHPPKTGEQTVTREDLVAGLQVPPSLLACPVFPALIDCPIPTRALPSLAPLSSQAAMTAHPNFSSSTVAVLLEKATSPSRRDMADSMAGLVACCSAWGEEVMREHADEVAPPFPLVIPDPLLCIAAIPSLPYPLPSPFATPLCNLSPSATSTPSLPSCQLPSSRCSQPSVFPSTLPLHNPAPPSLLIRLHMSMYPLSPLVPPPLCRVLPLSLCSDTTCLSRCPAVAFRTHSPPLSASLAFFFIFSLDTPVVSLNTKIWQMLELHLTSEDDGDAERAAECLKNCCQALCPSPLEEGALGISLLAASLAGGRWTAWTTELQELAAVPGASPSPTAIERAAAAVERSCRALTAVAGSKVPLPCSPVLRPFRPLHLIHAR